MFAVLEQVLKIRLNYSIKYHIYLVVTLIRGYLQLLTPPSNAIIVCCCSFEGIQGPPLLALGAPGAFPTVLLSSSSLFDFQDIVKISTSEAAAAAAAAALTMDGFHGHLALQQQLQQ